MSAEGKLKTVLVGNTIKGINQFVPKSHIYQSKQTQTGPLEDVQFANDTIISFNTVSPGSVGVAKISNNYEFITDLWLRVRIRTEDGSAFKPISPFFVYSLIEEIKIRIPGTPHITYDPRLLIYKYLDQCETMEKRQEFLNIVGGKYLYIDGNSPNYFYAPIPLLGTSLHGNIMCKEKPYPIHMQNSPLEINVKWRPVNQIRVDAQDNRWEVAEAALIFKYKTLGTAAQLKKSLYMYQYLQNYDYEYELNPGVKEQVLLGLRGGETREILLAFIPDLVYFPNQYYRTVLPEGLKLMHNGQIIWQSDHQSYYFHDICSSNLPSYWLDSGKHVGRDLMRVWFHDPGATNPTLLRQIPNPHELNRSGFDYVGFTAWQLEHNNTRIARQQLNDICCHVITDVLNATGLPVKLPYYRPDLIIDSIYTFHEDSQGALTGRVQSQVFNIVLHEIYNILEQYHHRMIELPNAYYDPADPARDIWSMHPWGLYVGINAGNPIGDGQNRVPPIMLNKFFLYMRNILAYSLIKRRNYWVRIPIADILERQQKPGDYSLGADFNHSDLKLTWTSDVVREGSKGLLLVQYLITSVLSFDGGVAKLIQ